MPGSILRRKLLVPLRLADIHFLRWPSPSTMGIKTTLGRGYAAVSVHSPRIAWHFAYPLRCGSISGLLLLKGHFAVAIVT